jgi:SAM-dependent methyltransferase
MEDSEVARLLALVLSEYNQTPLATGDGYVHRPTHSELRKMRAIARHLPPNGLFVDIGTGPGIAPRFARMLGCRAISIDSCDASGMSALENVRLAGVEGHACDILRDPLPVESATADCVFLGDVIEHLIHSPKPALLEIFRVLKPGGVCIVSTPNATRLVTRLKVLLGYSNWPNLREYFHKSGHYGHHHEYTPSDLRFAFGETGFAVESLELYEESLRSVPIRVLGDMATHNRCKELRHSQPEPMAFGMGKIPLIALTELFPSLRGTMLLTARKPL